MKADGVKKDIGPQINIYRGIKLRRTEVITIVCLILFLFVIPFLIGFYKVLYGYAQFGPVAANAWGVSWFLLAFAFLVIFFIYFFHRLFVTQLTITLFKNGFTIHRLFRKDLTLCWDQVSELYVVQKKSNFAENFFQIHAIINTTDKKHLSLRSNEVNNLIDLITQIKSSVYAHLSPKLRGRLMQGKVLSFGPIEIHKNYLRLNRKFLVFSSKQIPWKEINFITIKAGYLIIKFHNPKLFRIRISRIPNIEILLSLIDDRTRFQT